MIAKRKGRLVGTTCILSCLFLFLKAYAVDSTDATNDFFDNEKIYDLPVSPITVEGEVANPGIVDLSKLQLRSVIVKEAVLKDGKDSFVGAYRYDGYSLYDILNSIVVQKKNEKEFPRIIDAFVTVENKKGEKSVITWGEIYYPAYLHQIIIATKVMRIVPSITKELWPLPKKTKLIIAQDLITERNISDPVKIAVASAAKTFIVNKGMNPMYIDSMGIYKKDSLVMTIKKEQETGNDETYRTVFYGRGKGIHGISTFEGIPLRTIIAPLFDVNAKHLRTGYFIVAARDGYRGVYSFSEIFNRNDQSETLLVSRGENVHGGKFKLFPAGDFFSDRAINSVSGIYFLTCK